MRNNFQFKKTLTIQSNRTEQPPEINLHSAKTPRDKPHEQQYFSIKGEYPKENTTSNSKLTTILDNISRESLSLYYNASTSHFKKKLDELNLKFYLETEKYLSNKTNEKNAQNSLFLLLFQEISLLIKEIGRLNVVIIENKYDNKTIKQKTEDFKLKEEMIKTLKESNLQKEKLLSEMHLKQNNLLIENEKLKKENDFYKETIQNFLSKKKVDDARMSDLTKAGSNISNENANEHQNLTSLINSNLPYIHYTQRKNPKKLYSNGIVKQVKQSINKQNNKTVLITEKDLSCSVNKENNITNTLFNEFHIQEYSSRKGNGNSKMQRKPELIVSRIEDYNSKIINTTVETQKTNKEIDNANNKSVFC